MKPKMTCRAGIGLTLLLLIVTAVWSPAHADEGGALSNSDVISLCGLGLGDEVVIAKIKQAEAVDFQLEVADLAGLKEAGVSGPVIAAMLERTTAPAAVPMVVGGMVGTDVTPRADVTVEASDGKFDLTGMYGHYSMTHVFITVLAYMNYEGKHSAVRFADRRPTFLVAIDKNPKGIFYVVKAEIDDDDNIRSVKAGQISAYNMQSILKPDEDWTLDYEAKEIEPGLWRLELDKDLAPGEYGVWKAAGSDPTSMNAYLYDFAVE